MEKLPYGIPIYVVIPIAIALVISLLYIVIKAFNEGREVSFWPPKIGPRTKSDNSEDRQEVSDPGVRDSPSHAKSQKTDKDPSPGHIPSATFPANPIGILRIVSGPLVGRTFFLTEEHRSVTVGRAPTCDIQFPESRFFSNTHFRIDLTPIDSTKKVSRDYKVEIVDCGSTNGTFVNGRRVSTKELQSNDRIQGGDTTIIFHRIGD